MYTMCEIYLRTFGTTQAWFAKQHIGNTLEFPTR